MADNISASVANGVLGLLLNGTPFTVYTYSTSVYAQLHNGSPGTTGTSNVANSGTRQPTGAFQAPSGGTTSNVSAINWTSVASSETYSHVSLWSASTGGTFICSGTISAAPITAAQNFSIAAGAMTVSLPTAS
jgi:hypothetical protein